MIMRPSIADMLFVDFETAADTNYSLRRMSTRAYIEDPRFKILTVAIAEGASNITVYSSDGAAGLTLADARVRLERARDSGRWFVCHNVSFDGLVSKLHWGLEAQHYFDTTAYLALLGIARSLADGGCLVGVPKQESPVFSEEVLRDPAQRARFFRYNATDVLICRELAKRCIADARFPDFEFAVVDQSCREGLRGVRIDRAAAMSLHARFASRRNAALLEITTAFPGFNPTDLRRTRKVMAFLRDALNVSVPTLDLKQAQITSA